MYIQLRLVEESGRNTADSDGAALRRQLAAQPELRGHVNVLRSSPAEGEMGGGPALVTVLLSSGSALSVLLGTLPALLRARRSPTSVEITLADGRSAKVTADSAEDARTLLEAAMRDHVNPPQL
ncbi:hypothetical protein ACIF85_47350 [Streptomyces sp. NPDC086033]|uniref:effector-associated constant component EACC1 n=1 Tax=Streptomyces sp. NPDC086033 TaxID=3365747 RepID=UPI0037CF20E1